MSVVAIAFTPRPASESPNLRRSSHAISVDVYYRALVVSFASVRRWNNHLRLLFVTDGEAPPAYAAALHVLGVETLNVAFDHRPPVGFSGTFIGSLYTLDALHALSTASHSQVVLLDPDVLCRGDLSPLLSATRGSVGALPLQTGLDEDVNGLTGADAFRLHVSLDASLGLDRPTHYGGECYVVDAIHFPALLDRADQAWGLSLNNFSAGMKYFTTEEHVLSFALRRVPVISVRPYISRIWTTRTVRTVPPDVLLLPLWHLPSEKDRAFARLFAPATDPASWFWATSDAEHAKRIRRATQVPRRSVRKWMGDSAARVVRRAQSLR